MLATILVFSALGGIGGALGSALLLLAPDTVRRRLVPVLITFAAGSMLGAALLGLLPEALAMAPAQPVLATVLAGIVLFFVLEKLVLWRHAHEEPGEATGRPAPLILLGDGMHNLIDGVVIASAFLASVPLGIATAIAVLAHELPQEIGDFAILLDSGYDRRRALLWNALSGSAAVPGALLTWLAFEGVEAAMPYLLALSAASFLYIAVADLMPALQRRRGAAATLRQLALLLAGIALVAAIHGGAPHRHGAQDAHQHGG